MRDKLVEQMPLVAALLLTAFIAFIWSGRLFYPFDLEWMEGGMLSHAWRVQQGLGLYVEPSPDFVPFIYPPGYSYLLAALSFVFPLTPALGRAVSIVSIVLAAASIAVLLGRRGVSYPIAMGSAATFLGAYQGSGAFFDLVRPDSLGMALLGWSVVLAFEKGRKTAIASALLLVLAFFVKHNLAAFGLALALARFQRNDGADARVFILASVLPAIVGLGILQTTSDGRFLRYLLEVPQTHPVYFERFMPGMGREWGTAFPIALLTIAGALLMTTAHRFKQTWVIGLVVLGGMLTAWFGSFLPGPIHHLYYAPSAAAFFLTGVGLVGGSALLVASASRRTLPENADLALLGLTALFLCGWMRAHNGGYLNVLIPLFFVSSIGFGLALGRLKRRGFRQTAAILCVLQLAYSANMTERAKLTPTPADVSAGWRVVDQIKTVPGKVLVPHAAWLPVYAGKEPSLHYMAVWDLDYDRNPFRPSIQTIRNAAARGYWDLVIDGSRPFPYGTQEAYPQEVQLLDPKGWPLRPKMGWDVKPVTVRSR